MLFEEMMKKWHDTELMCGVQESIAAYRTHKEQGEYRSEDYFSLPEIERAELIDGVFYDMAAPSIVHQLLAGALYHCFSSYIDENEGECIPLISPVGVQLDRDDKTVVEPDVMIVCDRNKLKGKVVYGAPDLVVEVLSPSTGRKDKYLKLLKYANAGVREYWIVDPDKKRVIVYDLEQDSDPVIYTFSDKIPLRIFDGKCQVDFTKIEKKITL